jgi:hypothetical protein
VTAPPMPILPLFFCYAFFSIFHFFSNFQATCRFVGGGAGRDYTPDMVRFTASPGYRTCTSSSGF